MKMKMFVAPTVEEAMAQVRAEFGADAVILSQLDENGRVEIRAAVERSFNQRFAAPVFSTPRPQQVQEETRDSLSASLRWHGAVDGFVQMVAEAGSRLGAGLEPLGALAAGLDGALTFNPIHPRPEKSILLVGPHGSGKTTATAKLSIRMSVDDMPLEAVAADFDVSGGAYRLAALTQRPSVTACYAPEALTRLVRERDEAERKLIIDGPGFNPIDAGDMDRLKDLISRLNVEPVLVLGAEGHPMEIEDNARAFREAGCRRVIVTRLDAVRRRGGLIGAISSARLSIAQLGMTPSVGGGLVPASSERIARLLLAEASNEAEQFKGAA